MALQVLNAMEPSLPAAEKLLTDRAALTFRSQVHKVVDEQLVKE